MQGHSKDDSSKQEKEARKEEVKKLFINLSEDEINDITELSYILTNPEIVTSILEKLEAKVAEKFHEKLVQANITMSPADKKVLGEYTEQTFLIDDDENPTRRKILSDVLYQWAIENNLVEKNAEGHGKFLRFNRLLADDKAFLSHIRQGQFFKDRGTPQASHGVWTHFIQWYIIAEHFKSLKEKSPLHQPVLELYKMLGDNEKNACSKKKVSLWVWLCDDNATCKTEHDFRSPDKLHAFITHHVDKFKYLSKFIQYKNSTKALTNTIPDTATSTFDPATGKKTPWK